MREIRSLRAYADVVLGRQRSPQHDTGPFMTRYLRAANVRDGELDLRDVKTMNFEPVEQARFSLKPGDVLVTEGSGSLGSVGASAVWQGELDGAICFQNTLLRLRPRPSTDGRFLAWWCRHAFADGLFASISSGANIFHLSAERVRSLPMSHLPLQSQRTIADFLDTETARIGALLAKKRRVIELLAERESSSLASLLDSPECRRVPLRHLLAMPVTDGPHETPAFLSEGVPFLSVDNIGDGSIRFDGCRRISEADHNRFSRKVRPQRGDVLLTKAASVGRAAVVRTDEVFNVWSPIAVLRPRPQLVTADYLAMWLRSLSARRQITALSTNNTQQNIAMRDIAELRVSVPTIPDQLRLGVELDQLRRFHFGVADRMRDQVALLLEHRQALITAAVTGEMTVPKGAA